MSELNKHFAKGDQWEDDVILATKKNAKTWKLAAILGWLSSTAMAIALAGLMPMKTSEPYVIRIDDRTGEISQGTALKSSAEEVIKLTESEALRQSMLVRYVVNRETFDRKDINTRYQATRTFSNDDTFSVYASDFDLGEKNNIYKRLSDSRRIVEVLNVTFLTADNDTAAVRFKTKFENTMDPKLKAGEYVALIKFRYLQEPNSVKGRWENPLGFQVTEYRVDQASL